MSFRETLEPYFTSTDTLLHEAIKDGKTYIEPALKNLASVSIPILREVIAPASFRNADTEITDIAVEGVRRVRAVANKFKFGERSRGMQVLRLFGAGAKMAQNRTYFERKDPASNGYDLNTIVFGDSANRDKYVLPVKAAAQYSDAVSLAPYGRCVDDTFHNRASEDGTLFDATEKQNSVNLFERHFVMPGTLLLQVVTFNGRTAPIEALEHLLLCIGLAGAYGGQTSVYGVNVRNHIVGIYAGKFERAIASPYEAIKGLGAAAAEMKVADAVAEMKVADAVAEMKVADAVTAIHGLFAGAYPVQSPADAVATLQRDLIGKVERKDQVLELAYRATHKKVGEFFNEWFGTV